MSTKHTALFSRARFIQHTGLFTLETIWYRYFYVYICVYVQIVWFALVLFINWNVPCRNILSFLCQHPVRIWICVDFRSVSPLFSAMKRCVLQITLDLNIFHVGTQVQPLEMDCPSTCFARSSVCLPISNQQMKLNPVRCQTEDLTEETVTGIALSSVLIQTNSPITAIKAMHVKFKNHQLADVGKPS